MTDQNPTLKVGEAVDTRFGTCRCLNIEINRRHPQFTELAVRFGKTTDTEKFDVGELTWEEIDNDGIIVGIEDERLDQLWEHGLGCWKPSQF